MSLEEINIHFGQMKGVSEQLAETADSLQRFVNAQGMEAVMGVKKVWASENVSIFTGKGEKSIETLQRIAENLRELSADILKKAQQIYEVEKWNVLIAKTRYYG